MVSVVGICLGSLDVGISYISVGIWCLIHAHCRECESVHIYVYVVYKYVFNPSV